MLNAQQLVVGIFQNHVQAELAINELHQVGFDNRHVRYAKHGISIGGMLNKIKISFRGQDVSANGIYDDLVNMGMPPGDARYYQSEFEAGRSIVAVLKSGVPLVATSILIRNGGYIVNEHFAQPIDHNKGTSKPAPRIYATLLKGFTKLLQILIDEHLFVGPPSGVQKPPTENVDATPNGAHEHVAESPYYVREDGARETDKDLINA